MSPETEAFKSVKIDHKSAALASTGRTVWKADSAARSPSTKDATYEVACQSNVTHRLSRRSRRFGSINRGHHSGIGVPTPTRGNPPGRRWNQMH